MLYWVSSSTTGGAKYSGFKKANSISTKDFDDGYPKLLFPAKNAIYS